MRKNALWYQFIRTCVQIWTNLFFKKMILEHTDRLPRKKPIVMVMNHQNSFLDAFIFVGFYWWKFQHFMTNAMVFRIPVVKHILRSLNLIPVFRMKDGVSEVGKNKEIFDECTNYLKMNDVIIIFPEASHNLNRRLRPLSKGFTRIVFGTMNKFDWDLDLQILPISLNYSDHTKARNYVYGYLHEPIPALKFKEAYDENPNKAALHLKVEVEEKIKSKMIHIDSLDEYPVHHILMDDLEPNPFDLINPDLGNERTKKISEHIQETDINKANELLEGLDKLGLRLKYLINTPIRAWQKLALIPGILIYLNTYIPHYPIRHITEKLLTDHAWDASLKLLAAGILFPFYYLIVFSILYFGFNLGIIAIVYLALSLLSVILYPSVKKIMTVLSQQRAFRSLEKQNPDLYKNLVTEIEHFQSLRKEIIDSE